MSIHPLPSFHSGRGLLDERDKIIQKLKEHRKLDIVKNTDKCSDKTWKGTYPLTDGSYGTNYFNFIEEYMFSEEYGDLMIDIEKDLGIQNCESP